MGTITLKKHQKSEHLPLLASLRKHEVQWQTSTFPRIFSTAGILPCSEYCSFKLPISLKGRLSTAVPVLFRLLLIYHPPNLFQCHIPILPLNITDFNLPAVSPLQSEPQLEFDRRTTNHGLQ
ncbi:predicted protein [Botrytis cinerea T4]|uniref:Uncharacterized protein n=1 Tax=Botryotinia fuckeliana (strain T4) TaxID=999810 RepID=G2YKD6_BOTF4|nr:predicted protein [Botrytis cinerea T4]